VITSTEHKIILGYYMILQCTSNTTNDRISFHECYMCSQQARPMTILLDYLLLQVNHFDWLKWTLQ